MFQFYFKDFFDLLFPRTCITCSNVLIDKEPEICISCELDLFPTNLKHQDEDELRKRFEDQSLIKRIYTFSKYEKGNRVQRLIHALKYKKQKNLGDFIGKQLGDYLRLNELTNQFDLLVPIPLHKEKLKKRGYNQSLEIANGINKKVLKLLNHDNILKRKAEGTTQAQKTRVDRLETLTGVFEVNMIEEFKKSHILLVDDVLTTGATLTVCATLLKTAGYKKVSVLSFAYA